MNMSKLQYQSNNPLLRVRIITLYCYRRVCWIIRGSPYIQIQLWSQAAHTYCLSLISFSILMADIWKEIVSILTATDTTWPMLSERYNLFSDMKSCITGVINMLLNLISLLPFRCVALNMWNKCRSPRAY